MGRQGRERDSTGITVDGLQLVIRHRTYSPVGRPFLDVTECIQLQQKTVQRIVMQPSNREARVQRVLQNPLRILRKGEENLGFFRNATLSDLVLFDESLLRQVINEMSQRLFVAGQGVVVVEAVDVNFAQVQFVAGEHGMPVHVAGQFFSWETGENDEIMNDPQKTYNHRALSARGTWSKWRLRSRALSCDDLAIF